MQETSPAPGYNLDETIYEFTTDDRGYVNGELLYTIKLTNRPNRLHVSKVDATNSEEVPGAYLVLTDENGRVMDEWIVLALVAALLVVVISINTRVNSTASNAQKTIDSKLGEVDAQLGAGIV